MSAFTPFSVRGTCAVHYVPLDAASRRKWWVRGTCPQHMVHTHAWTRYKLRRRYSATWQTVVELVIIVPVKRHRIDTNLMTAATIASFFPVARDSWEAYKACIQLVINSWIIWSTNKFTAQWPWSPQIACVRKEVMFATNSKNGNYPITFLLTKVCNLSSAFCRGKLWYQAPLGTQHQGSLLTETCMTITLDALNTVSAAETGQRYVAHLASRFNTAIPTRLATPASA